MVEFSFKETKDAIVAQFTTIDRLTKRVSSIQKDNLKDQEKIRELQEKIHKRGIEHKALMNVREKSIIHCEDLIGTLPEEEREEKQEAIDGFKNSFDG